MSGAFLDAGVRLAYLLAAGLFIVGLRRMSSPRTARAGNRLSAVGMFIAVVAALLSERILSPLELLVGLAIGSAIGLWLARKTEMTSMPELVAAFNGVGGAASALVAIAEVFRVQAEPGEPYGQVIAFTVGLSVLIGAVTLTGSFVAYGKLRGTLKRTGFPGLRFVSVGLLGALIATLGLFVRTAPTLGPEHVVLLGVIAALSCVIGVLLVLPIGGADMPVVVALLNAYSGLAAASTGFVLGNEALVVSGALVGASGVVLTQIMCRAMNRSLGNVLLGGFGATAAGPAQAAGDALPVRTTTPDDAAILMAYAARVVVVPGYGLAVAQAQHEVREMADLLAAEGVDVRYAIHPVAGRMPGHMNVLLAEANVPYDVLVEMDDINADFPQVDVVLVVGANDVVNPGARTDPQSPIFGMPVLNVDEATNVIVLKRSMAAGYAGIENPLFHLGNTQMLFGDAKASIKAIVAELKQLQTA